MTWEARMAEKARRRLDMEDQNTELLHLHFYQAERPSPPSVKEVIYFKGNCDVCGEELSIEHSFSDALIDYAYDEDGRLCIWTRHYAVAPENANPDCARYFSTVTEYRREKEYLQ